MVRDNGLHPQDPDYDDYGFSDFRHDYEPSDEQLIDYLYDRPEEALELIKMSHEAASPLAELETRWFKENEDEIEKEWEADHDRD